MGLFSSADIDKINKVAAQSKIFVDTSPVKSSSVNDEIQKSSEKVIEYFKDSPAILISDIQSLHDYISKIIDFGYAGIDTETTGLDRINDTIVGASLYVPGEPECYIPMKHLVPIFDTPYKNQLSYEDVGEEFQRIADSDTKLIFANADFDLSMIHKDLKVDFNDRCYYDVILAWRCLKENEKDNALKVLYNKYVMKGKGDPMKFADFFSPKLFPYCKPDVAKLYAANDAKITYDLFKWQLPYVTKDNPKCKKAHLEGIADLVWNVELPLIKVCQMMHRNGMYLDKTTANVLVKRYDDEYTKELNKLYELVDAEIAKQPYTNGIDAKRPFHSGKDFNPNSTPHVRYLVYSMLNVPKEGSKESTDKSVLADLNLPVTNQILKVRSLKTLISTFVEKLPQATTPDSRIHAQFKQIGADTGRFSSADPNLQNIPSHADDIRHMFRATPGYAMISSDYSAQEPRITAFVSQDPNMIKSFQEGKDIYASIASLAFHVPYENCLEFNPITGENQPEGKKRRSSAKTIVLGITYGRSVPSIADQLYGKDKNMPDEEKVKEAQKVYDAVLSAFPNLKRFMISSQNFAKKYGYTETILKRRRHIPEMQLQEFEFKPLKGYVNPDIDPLDPNTLNQKSAIPERIVNQLTAELKSYKYYGQVARRIRELYDDHIKVINNRPKISEASRKVVNGIIQGSAADQTKMAMLLLENNKEWKDMGGRLLVPVHDELICEVPIERWKEGGELVSKMMRDAASYLPFDSKCDVTTSLRWYGLEYPCQYDKPKDISDIKSLSESEIAWIQYHLIELEYILPIIPNEDGSPLLGDFAVGVNGKYSVELDNLIEDYISTRRITKDRFIEYIDKEVVIGVRD